MSDDFKPWHKYPNEPNKAYHAFEHYRDLPPEERSMGRACQYHIQVCNHGVTDPVFVPGTNANPHWKTWRIKWNWDARVAAHDSDLSERRRRQKARDIEQMNARHATLATSFQQQVLEHLNAMLQEADEAIAQGQPKPRWLTPAQLASWLETATAVERRARGEATEIVRTDGTLVTQPAVSPLQLSNLTDEELKEFERLVTKAGVSLG